MALNQQKPGIAAQLRMFRRRKFVSTWLLSLVTLVASVMIGRGWLSQLADHREAVMGRIVNVQVVDVDGRRELWVYWARFGKLTIERRDLPNDLPSR